MKSLNRSGSHTLVNLYINLAVSDLVVIFEMGNFHGNKFPVL